MKSGADAVVCGVVGVLGFHCQKHFFFCLDLGVALIKLCIGCDVEESSSLE